MAGISPFAGKGKQNCCSHVSVTTSSYSLCLSMLNLAREELAAVGSFWEREAAKGGDEARRTGLVRRDRSAACCRVGREVVVGGWVHALVESTRIGPHELNKLLIVGSAGRSIAAVRQVQRRKQHEGRHAVPVAFSFGAWIVRRPSRQVRGVLCWSRPCGSFEAPGCWRGGVDLQVLTPDILDLQALICHREGVLIRCGS